MTQAADTIVAPLTPAGTSAVCILRLSGPKVRELITKLCSQKAEKITSHPRTMHYTILCDLMEPDEALDHSLVVFFPKPNSFTGEDCAEIHIHGSSWIKKQLLQGFYKEGCRLAKPGEFSERAFFSGKLDLTQSEAIATLVSAETARQARMARRQLEGDLKDHVSRLGEPLRNLLAEMESRIDFPEEDVEPAVISDWLTVLENTKHYLNQAIQSADWGMKVGEGADVVLCGLPNVGKSSLMNALGGIQRVIVSPRAGTTRDAVEMRLDLGGYLINLWDTAGLESDNAQEELNALGIQKSWQIINKSTCCIFLVDPNLNYDLQNDLLKRVAEKSPNTIVIQSKLDIPINAKDQSLFKEIFKPIMAISAVTKTGLAELREAIIDYMESSRPESDTPILSSLRHIRAFTAALDSTEETIGLLNQNAPRELSAFCLREALGKLEEIIGITDNEEILGRIFSKFCIGK